MRIATILTAKTQLSRLVEAAAGGQEIIIAWARQPVAKLVPLAGPVTKPPCVLGVLADRMDAPSDFDAPLPTRCSTVSKGTDATAARYPRPALGFG